MSPIRYNPERLGHSMAYFENRIKNRQGTATCSDCNELSFAGALLDAIKLAKNHDKKTGHWIDVVEEVCRNGLIITN